jgi:Protein of unknown function (DUF1552)
MKPLRLNRRTLLRGMAGGVLGSLALPTFEAMLNSHGTAYADGLLLPKRFGVFFWGNGVRLKQWVPQQTGAAWEPSEELAPLANVKEYVSVLSGMNIKTGNERGHHAGCVGILSGAPMISQDPQGAPYASTFSAPSIDQVVATHLNPPTRFRSLELGVSKRTSGSEGTTLKYLSHNGPDNPNPPEYSPAAAFKRLFVDGFVSPGSTKVVDPRLALRRSVIDAVRTDARALQQRLGATDRQRLEQHIDSIRALETQIQAIQDAAPPPSACVAPGDPGDPTGDDHLTAITDAMANLLALSLACDQSRVFSIQFSGSVGSTVYKEIGVTTEHHGITHDEPGDQPTVNAITVFIMKRFATFLEQLKSTTEGAGNLLDRCAILASTDCAEGQPHSLNDYPVLIAGGGGGSLIHPGIHYRSSNGENTSNALLTLLQAMDIDVTEFGNAGGKATTTVGALRV